VASNLDELGFEPFQTPVPSLAATNARQDVGFTPRGSNEGPLNATNLVRLTVFATAYVLAVKLAEGAYGSLSVPCPLWLPDSVLLCALLVTPSRTWWILLAALAPLRLITGAVPGTPLWFQLVSIANDGVKAVAAAWLLQRILGQPIRLQTLKEYLIFLVVAAAVCPLMSALAAAPFRYMLGDDPATAASIWFLGDSVAQVIVTPALLYWCNREYRFPRARVVELLVLLTGLSVTATSIFLLSPSPSSSILIYTPVPFLLWAAIRLRPFGTANAIGLVALLSMVSAVRGTGVFATEAMLHSVVSLQLYLLVVGVSLLTLSILVVERETLLRREIDFGGRLLDTQDRERERIARELHDDFGQRLAMVQVDLDRLPASVAVTPSAFNRLGLLAHEVDEIVSDLRSLSRSLHPSALEVAGLEMALRQLCREFSVHHQVRVEFSCSDPPDRLEREVSISLYRIAQEALQNVVKHSESSTASVTVSCDGGRLVLVVSDSGKGFDVKDQQRRVGLGLVSMRERVRPLGGKLIVSSSRLGGTKVRAEIPLGEK
jgi:two-component system sensor histidine kinase UhpB